MWPLGQAFNEATLSSELFSSASCSALPPFGWVMTLPILLTWAKDSASFVKSTVVSEISFKIS